MTRGTKLLAGFAATVVAIAVAGKIYLKWRRMQAKTPVALTTLTTESTILPRVTRATDALKAPLPTKATLTIDGKVRRYLTIAPPGQNLPLVLVFHGDGGDAEGFHDAFPFEAASGEGAVVAYPEGIDRTWDLDSLVSNSDVKFVETLVDTLAQRHGIDRTRVFAIGYSSGGFLANVLACQRSGLLRAISSNAGGAPYKQALLFANGFPKCPGQAPVAAIALHGERDFGVTIDSGRFSAEYWAYVNGCDTGAMETTGYEECHAYRGCPRGKDVVFCAVPGLGHWVWKKGAEASWTFFLRQ